MDTMVTTDRIIKKKTGLGGAPRKTGPNGNGSRGNGGDDFGRKFLPDTYRIAMWVALAAIAMMFTALTSAYIVRAGWSNDWVPLTMPRILWLSTALILVSSFTIETARRSLKQAADGAFKGWLMLTAILGIGFLVAQLWAWKQLVAQGVYLASNPHGSFFYVLTGVHGVHLLGGILALDYLLLRAWRRRAGERAEVKRQAAADVVAIYWHFMDGLWLYLFLLLFFWR